MTHNPYAAPLAEVADIAVGVEHPFYVVSRFKLVVLTFGSLGIYLVYWTYRNWKLQKRARGLDVWPVMRGLFPIFFFHSLFDEVDHTLQQTGRSFAWSPKVLATSIVLLLIAINLSDRLLAAVATSNGVSLPIDAWAMVISVVGIGFVSALLARAQAAINFACDDPLAASNKSFTWANWLWLSLMALFWLMVILGTLIEFGVVAE